MTMRITGSMVVRSALNGMNAARRQLSITQEQSASGLRVNRPSDDPVAASRATQLRGESAEVEQYRHNVSQARARLGTTEDAISSAEDAVVRARELAIEGANGTLDANSRQTLAKEVETLHDELLAASNARSEGAWVFAGTANGQPAFTSSGPFVSGSPPPTVTFGGNSTQIEIAIDQGRRATATLDGRRVFQGDADGDGSPDPGREDVFAVLGELWRALDTNDQAAVSASLDRLDRVQGQFQLELAHVGAATQQLDAADQRLSSQGLVVTKSLSDAQDADTEQVFSRLVVQETALQAALESASRAVQPSLLNFLK